MLVSTISIKEKSTNFFEGVVFIRIKVNNSLVLNTISVFKVFIGIREIGKLVPNFIRFDKVNFVSLVLVLDSKDSQIVVSVKIEVIVVPAIEG